MKPTATCCPAEHLQNEHRRGLFKMAMGASVLASAASVNLLMTGKTHAASLTQAQRDQLTADQVISLLKQGNRRFRNGEPQEHDYLAQKISSASGQYPAAAILSCIDSRAPAEIIFDTGIGDAFNARVAGNAANEDLIGSLEFACAAAGAKLVLVMGHSACGAIQGAIAGVQLGHLTGLLDRIKPSIDATVFAGERSAQNEKFVDAVAITHVLNTVQTIRQKSSILATLEAEGKIKMVGAIYHLSNGMVEFL